MQNSIEQTIQRTRQYWYIDGFGEILTGVILLLLAILNLLSGLMISSPIAGLIISIGYPLVVLAGVIGGRKFVRTLKEKFTFPRTGFIQYNQPAPSIRKKRAITAGTVAFSISILTVIFARGLDDRWVTLGTGLIFAAFLVFFAMQIPLTRFYWLAAWSVAVSIVAGMLPVAGAFQTAILLGGISLGWLAGGGYALKTYLDNTQSTAPGIGDY
jgi:MFS family permease